MLDSNSILHILTQRRDHLEKSNRSKVSEKPGQSNTSSVAWVSLSINCSALWVQTSKPHGHVLALHMGSDESNCTAFLPEKAWPLVFLNC